MESSEAEARQLRRSSACTKTASPAATHARNAAQDTSDDVEIVPPSTASCMTKDVPASSAPGVITAAVGRVSYSRLNMIPRVISQLRANQKCHRRQQHYGPKRSNLLLPSDQCVYHSLVGTSTSYVLEINCHAVEFKIASWLRSSRQPDCIPFIRELPYTLRRGMPK